MQNFSFDYIPVALSLLHVVLGIAVLIAAKFALTLLSPYSTDTEMTSRDNPAFGLAIAGYCTGSVLVYLAAAISAGPLPQDQGAGAVLVALGQDFAWALGGIVALNASRWLLDRALITHFRNDREIVSNRNVAAGALECGAYLGSALILAGAIRQPGGTIWTALAIFVLGQLALILLGRLYQRLVGYDIGGEIRTCNLAAGAAFALTIVALALIMVKAISGEFVAWSSNLAWFAVDAVLGLGLLAILRWTADAALLPNARIKDEIVRDRNVNVGLVEGVIAVGIAAIILFLF